MSAADPTAIFYQHLQSSGLLSAAQLRELWGWIAHKRPDVQATARELNRRGWLTAFQIKEIAKGRASGLRRIAGRYVLLDILGEGGMGRVYKANDTLMGRDVAFKEIRKEKLAHATTAGRFVQEMIALGRMSKHPNVVEVFQAEQVGDNHFCVMEYIDGPDLTKLVRDHGVMSVPAACDAIRQAALGLQHAFEANLVHRDIKPSNIIVPRNGGPVKLVDLGLARLMEPPGGVDAHRVTQEGFVIGTPDFLAPEQARDPMSVDVRADIYALGGTLFYVLTGRVPYDGGTPTEKLLRHHTDPPPSLLKYRPDAPPQLEQLIHWCMAKRAEGRPQTPMQLAIALQPYCPPPPARAGTGWHSVAATVRSPGPVYPAYALPAPPVAAGIPLPEHDPNPSSQVFKLPPQTNDADPIRKRSEQRFPTAMVLVGLGALLVFGILGFAVYRLFLGARETAIEPFTNTQGMKMVKLDGGTFRMGSHENEPGRRPDEGPVHEVTVRGPFFMSATEVTNGQFLRVMGANPSQSTKLVHRSEHLPVDSVTWEEANDFCRKLTEKEKEKGQPWMRKGWEYRLPTEAEWEYACRGGTDTPTPFGDRLVFGTQAVFRATGEDPLEVGGDAFKPLEFPQEAGRTEPNRLGLYDMNGNVAEWCRDWFRSEAYKDGTRDNPTGPADGDRRVIRGGSFREPASAARSAAREGLRPTERRNTVGFRVVFAPTQK